MLIKIHSERSSINLLNRQIQDRPEHASQIRAKWHDKILARSRAVHLYQWAESYTASPKLVGLPWKVVYIQILAAWQGFTGCQTWVEFLYPVVHFLLNHFNSPVDLRFYFERVEIKPLFLKWIKCDSVTAYYFPRVGVDFKSADFDPRLNNRQSRARKIDCKILVIIF